MATEKRNAQTNPWLLSATDAGLPRLITFAVLFTGIGGFHQPLMQVGAVLAWACEHDVDAAMVKLAKDGYDPVFGARPLKRTIQEQIENPLAKRIVDGSFTNGDHILVDVNGEVFNFEKASEPVAAQS